MSEVINLILAVSLVGCLIYIVWLHRSHSSTQKSKNEKVQPNTDTESMAFLRSDYDWSVNKDEDSLIEQLKE